MSFGRIAYHNSTVSNVYIALFSIIQQAGPQPNTAVLWYATLCRHTKSPASHGRLPHFGFKSSAHRLHSPNLPHYIDNDSCCNKNNFTYLVIARLTHDSMQVQSCHLAGKWGFSILAWPANKKFKHFLLFSGTAPSPDANPSAEGEIPSLHHIPSAPSRLALSAFGASDSTVSASVSSPKLVSDEPVSKPWGSVCDSCLIIQIYLI